MSKQFSKQKNSQQKLIGTETWSSGDPQLGNNLFRFAKPPRRITQKFMTTQYEQSHREVAESHEGEKLKVKQHRRRQSSHMRPNNEEEIESQELFYNPQSKSYNNTPKLKRDESKEKISDSSQQIEYRFKEIESIMGLENQNLRQQKDYLLKTIYKMQLKQKQYKNKLNQYRDKTLQLEQQNQLLRQKYQKARDFISNGIGKMQQAISKQPIEDGSNSNTAHHSNESSINVTQQIDELNDKFDALMYEYQKTRQPELRKKCMEIAKELRKLRKIQEGGGKGKK